MNIKNTPDDLYTLEELIERLENIKHGIDDRLNFPKAFLTLAKEIEKIKNEPVVR